MPRDLLKSVGDLNRQISEAKGDDMIVGTLVSKVLKSIAFVHHQHLSTKVFSRHLALKEYYEGMPEVLDCFSECSIASGYVALYGPESSQTSVEGVLDELMSDCREVHDYLDDKGQPELVNPLEDVMTFITSIKYKLALAG